MTLAAAPFLLTAFPLALFAAALTDLQRFVIPNWTCLLLIGGFAIAFAGGVVTGGLGMSDLLGHLGVGLAAFMLGFMLWALGLWGGGDGKLLAAAALWFDPSSALTMLLWTAVFGGAVAVVGMVLAAWKDALLAMPVVSRLPIEKYAKTIPYGVAIAAGALVALPASSLFAALTSAV